MKNFINQIKSYSEQFIPYSFVALRQGYTLSLFLKDLMAGLTVGVIALPLAMAFAIGSGANPERGLISAIIAGFLISFLGGSPVQVGGPTVSFVVIVYGVIEKYGYDGLVLATLMAGFIIILMGLFRCGVLLKFIPYPVTIGFTTGIAVNIFSSQIKDFFGLEINRVPPDFFDKWALYFSEIGSLDLSTVFIGLTTLGTIFILRYFYPLFPGAIAAVAATTALTYFSDLPVETIQTKFGGIPSSLPVPAFPHISLDLIQEVFPAAITIALLGTIESLLSAVVADGMIGHRHRSNGELVAQGIANIGSALFGGIPAAGAIARTTANIKMGAKTPMAGMIHSAVLLIIMVFLSPLASKIPLSCLSAVLIFVAWNMSELSHFVKILKSDMGDAIVLVITFLLTVLIDLTVAVQVGVILSAVLFLKKMTDSTKIEACKIIINEEENTPSLEEAGALYRKDVPSDVLVFEIKGPFFFGIADSLNETLRVIREKPRVFILRMRQVPMIDTTGLEALKNFALKCKQENISFLMSGIQPKVLVSLNNNGITDLLDVNHLFETTEEALVYARDKKIEFPLTKQVLVTA